MTLEVDCEGRMLMESGKLSYSGKPLGDADCLALHKDMSLVNPAWKSTGAFPISSMRKSLQEAFPQLDLSMMES